MSKKLSIYVHLPFCKTKCAYCDFYSKEKLKEPEREAQMNLYQRALLSHFQSSSPRAQDHSVDTIYFGGGTPTYYGATRISQLLEGLGDCFSIDPEAEITVEGNPESVSIPTIKELQASGVNRFSLGMQSAHQRELSGVGRPHSPQESEEAVSVLKACGISNFSLDLIYGLPHQTFDSWNATVEKAIALAPSHLSCYGLKVEEGTPLYTRVQQGELLPSEDMQADFYLWMVERLKQSGYEQYEISNFAKKDAYSRHNMGYWMGKPYMSFGASASSDFGGVRYTYVSDVATYCQCILEGSEAKGNLYSSQDTMSKVEREEEYLFLRLRTKEGLWEDAYEKALSLPFAPIKQALQQFQSQGWAEESSTHIWRLTPQGYLRSNLLFTHLLEIQEDNRPSS